MNNNASALSRIKRPFQLASHFVAGIGASAILYHADPNSFPWSLVGTAAIATVVNKVASGAIFSRKRTRDEAVSDSGGEPRRTRFSEENEDFEDDPAANIKDSVIDIVESEEAAKAEDPDDDISSESDDEVMSSTSEDKNEEDEEEESLDDDEVDIYDNTQVLNEDDEPSASDEDEDEDDALPIERKNHIPLTQEMDENDLEEEDEKEDDEINGRSVIMSSVKPSDASDNDDDGDNGVSDAEQQVPSDVKQNSKKKRLRNGLSSSSSTSSSSSESSDSSDDDHFRVFSSKHKMSHEDDNVSDSSSDSSSSEEDELPTTRKQAERYKDHVPSSDSSSSSSSDDEDDASNSEETYLNRSASRSSSSLSSSWSYSSLDMGNSPSSSEEEEEDDDAPEDNKASGDGFKSKMAPTRTNDDEVIDLVSSQDSDYHPSSFEAFTRGTTISSSAGRTRISASGSSASEMLERFATIKHSPFCDPNLCRFGDDCVLVNMKKIHVVQCDTRNPLDCTECASIVSFLKRHGGA